MNMITPQTKTSPIPAYVFNNYARMLSFRCINRGDMPVFFSEAQHNAEIANDLAKYGFPELALFCLFKAGDADDYRKWNYAAEHWYVMRPGEFPRQMQEALGFRLHMNNDLYVQKSHCRVRYDRAIRRDLLGEDCEAKGWPKRIKPLAADLAQELWMDALRKLVVALQLDGPVINQLMEN